MLGLNLKRPNEFYRSPRIRVALINTRLMFGEPMLKINR